MHEHVFCYDRLILNSLSRRTGYEKGHSGGLNRWYARHVRLAHSLSLCLVFSARFHLWISSAGYVWEAFMTFHGV